MRRFAPARQRAGVAGGMIEVGVPRLARAPVQQERSILAFDDFPSRTGRHRATRGEDKAEAEPKCSHATR